MVAPHGRVAQLGEHLLCKQGVTGSIPVTSTITIASIYNVLLSFRDSASAMEYVKKYV